MALYTARILAALSFYPILSGDDFPAHVRVADAIMVAVYMFTAGTSQPKKRGPKPDSRPALTRRQELNRQAQRTHRERKELYVKSLEDEVVRLKNVYGSAAANRSQAAAENKKLRAILAKHGLPRPPVVRPATGQQPPNHALQRSASQADNDHVMGEGKLQKKGADGD
ncbi:BRLZ protein [Geosmithia morbida]|uniref:BRLZ protein n=1 Tax=Geosmithia morbida TaxID=1094350 RepID=A0A9P4YVI0_9HYPO|nr:BRLZ protein [Geosmithia morbida]KAF4122572.1 BRLZ protein [Geosmithia morbida]